MDHVGNLRHELALFYAPTEGAVECLSFVFPESFNVDFLFLGREEFSPVEVQV